jgi:hypothetical protein
LEYEIVSSTRPEDGDKDDAVGSPHARRRLGTTKVAPAAAEDAGFLFFRIFEIF